MTVDDPDQLAAILAASRFVLLDFDGPVCSIFAGLPAPTVAEALRGLLAEHDAAVTGEASTSGDPLAVLRWTATSAPQLAPLVEQQLRDAELDAADTAEPTAGADDFLRACRDAGRRVAIVSNNSWPAIHAYLRRVQLAQLVHVVHGRDPNVPERMKPDPHVLHAALRTCGAAPTECVLIGDSTSDVQAGVAVGVRCMGYANKPGKVSHLTEAGAEAVTTSMQTLGSALARDTATRR